MNKSLKAMRPKNHSRVAQPSIRLEQNLEVAEIEGSAS
jgi:hypothetical protein